MPLVKFVHAADIHLDSPLRGLDRYEGAPALAMRGATRKAMKNLVDLCVDEEVDFLLLAGDLYDGNWKDYNTGLFFAAQMSRLREAAIPVVLIRGNHDAQSQITKSLRLPDNVRELSVRRPETVSFEKLGVAIHGQGFLGRVVTDDLAAKYPEALPGLFNIGILHTCAEGREGHESYAPCTLSTLTGKGYDYWALGHVHKREVLCKDPWIVFPGNLQGRHAKETGPKGATLVTVQGARITSVEHRSVDVVRWAVTEVAADEAVTPADVVDRVRATLQRVVEDAEGRSVAARIVITGETAAHAAMEHDPDAIISDIRAVATDVAGEVWVEKVIFRTRARINMADLRGRDDALGELLRSIDALRTDDDGLAAIAAELADLRLKLPADLREGDEALKLDDPRALAGMLDDVEQVLVPRLLGGERS